jgi:hypothetical protein
MTDPDWIGIRLQGPTDVMRRLAARLDRALQPNDDHGALTRDQTRSARLHFWIRPEDPEIEKLVDLLLAARPDGDSRPIRAPQVARPRPRRR